MDKSYKKLSFFLYHIPSYGLWLISFLFPRSKKKWCLGSQSGFAGSNTKYLLFEILETQTHIDVAWICDDKDTYDLLRNNQVPVYMKWSLQGIWFCLTAKVYIYTHGVGDVNFATSGGTFKINVWHGIGFKNIEYLAQLKWVNKHNPIHRILYPFYCTNHDFILSTSTYISTWLKDCFRCDEQTMIYAYPPRCSTAKWKKSKIEKFSERFDRNILPLIQMGSVYRRVFLYMPTYREHSKQNVLDASGFNLDEMNQILCERNDCMLIKFHHRDLGKLNCQKNYSNIIIVKENIDAYLLFPYVTVLITDYSSVYAEYMLYNDNVILFDFDKDLYEQYENGCYYNINDFISAIHAHSYEDLISLICEKENYPIPNFFIMKEKLWGKCTQNPLVEQVIRYLKIGKCNYSSN